MNANNSPYRFINTTTFVMGNRKNAGKTTFMNWALNQIREVESPAFATIGIDGESYDQIDGKAKPRITTCEGDAILTSFPMLKKSNGKYRIEKAFPINTPLGQLVVATTQRGGTVELVGPEHNQQLKQVTDYLNKELNYHSIVIDGAASRLTPVSSIASCGFYYVVNIDRGNLKKSLEQMQLLSFGAQLEMAAQETDSYKMDGALTASKINQLPRNCNTIIIDNLTSIFLNYEQIKRLSATIKIKVSKSIHLKGFVVILKDMSKNEFEHQYLTKGIKTELIYNPYVHQ
jgi:hypothetical protein